MSESQKGGPASRESKPNAGGQETVTKGAGPTSAKHRTRHRRLRRNTSTKIVSVVCACGQTALAQKPPALAGFFHSEYKNGASPQVFKREHPGTFSDRQI
jgi:hypothetical protein